MDYLIGSIGLFPYNFVPMGWLLCDGQMLQIANYSPLYALVGVTYGGNGQSTFAVPNLQGLEPRPNLRYFICVEGLFPTRD